MKDIKFRYFVKFNEYMDYSEQYGCLAGFFEQYQKEIEGGNEPKLMQFTGLQDTNGRDIYEGDVVKVIDDTFYNGEFTGQINQNEYGTWLIKGIGTCKLYDAIKELTVIGNIYETAETAV